MVQSSLRFQGSVFIISPLRRPLFLIILYLSILLLLFVSFSIFKILCLIVYYLSPQTVDSMRVEFRMLNHCPPQIPGLGRPSINGCG